MKAIALALLLAACAATPPAQDTFTGICALKPIGQNEEGLTFVMAHCEAAK